MPSVKNIVVIACAGSGKTTYIVEEALALKSKKVLVVTYTNENLDQIASFLIEKAGCVPPNIIVQSWFSFLLQEGVRPYQNQMTDQKRVQSIFFQTNPSYRHRKNDYLTPEHFIYSNKVSEFVYECDKKTKSLISKRLQQIYDHIFIDEVQDFAGYDLNVLEMLFDSNIGIVAVGDPRQATFSTNNSLKNKQHRRSNIYSWLKQKEEKGKITLTEMTKSHRCNQHICDFADKLFPDFPKTVSNNLTVTGHDGLFRISSNDLHIYSKTYNPKILRYNRRADTLGLAATNIGLIKGRTYERVLIFPTHPMLEYLKTGDVSKVGDNVKLYVAVTRARYSAAFVVDDAGLVNWTHADSKCSPPSGMV